jgi:hypothetical protein
LRPSVSSSSQAALVLRPPCAMQQPVLALS